MSLKKEIFSICNSDKNKSKKKIISIYKNTLIHDSDKRDLKIKKICHNLVLKELSNYHSTIDDRFFFIIQIIYGVIKISEKKISYPLILYRDPISKVNMLSDNNKPIDILNFFENSPLHECIFLKNSMGKMSYPFCLRFKDSHFKLSLKIGYFIRNSIKNYPQKKSMVLKKDKIKLNLRQQNNLSSDNPSITQLYSQFMVSENMSQIEKKVLSHRKKKSLPSKKYSNHDLMNQYVELDSDLPINVENRIIYLLSALVLKKYTPHINLPLFSFKSSISQMKLNLNLYPKIQKDILTKRIINNVSVLISEWCTYGNLKLYLNKESKLFRSNSFYWDILFFQIVSTLTIIQSVYPNFRHNDLHLKNILIQKTNPSLSENYLYQFRLQKQDYYFVIPDIGFQIRIWDYDWSSIDGLVSNRKATQKKRQAQNRTFDLFCCMYLLEKQYEQIMTGCMKNEHLKFFSDIQKGITESDMGIEKKHLLCTAQEFETPESILIKHSDPSKANSIFKQFLFSSEQIKNMNFCDQYKYP